MEHVVASMVLLAGVHFGAMLSPGPTALIVLRYSSLNRLQSTTPLILGIVAATLTNTALTLFGVAALILASEKLASALALLGSLYLLYLGSKNIFIGYQKFVMNESTLEEIKKNGSNVYKTSFTASFMDGYLVNLLNPKIAVFYVSVFSQVARPELPNYVLLGFGGQLVLQSFLFWSTFAILASTGAITKALNKSNGVVDILFGFALIGFAAYLFWVGL